MESEAHFLIHLTNTIIEYWDKNLINNEFGYGAWN